MANLNDHDIIFLNSLEFKPLADLIERLYNFKIISLDLPPFISFTSRKAVLHTSSGTFFLKEKPIYCSDSASLSRAAEFQDFLSKSLKIVPEILKTTNGKYYIKWKDRFFFLSKFSPGRVFNGSTSDIEKMLFALKDFQESAKKFNVKNTKSSQSYEVLDFFSIIEENLKNDKKSKYKLKYVQGVIAKLAKAYNSLSEVPHIMSHGDFAIFNILLNEREVIAINDFDNTTYFPRVHDMAEFLISATVLNYFGPISNLRYPIFLNPSEDSLELILDFYLKHFNLTEEEKYLLGIVADIVWLEILLLAVLKEDYSFSSIIKAVKYIESGSLRRKILGRLQVQQRKVFIWDFHGTLEIGTLHVLTEIANLLLKENGSQKKYTPEEFSAIGSFSWNNFFKSHLPYLSPKAIKDISNAAYDEKRFSYLLAKHSKARSGAKDILKFIKENDGINIVVSHSRQDKLGHYINHIGLNSYIDQYYGVDDDKVKSRQDILKRKAIKISELIKKYPDHIFFAVGDSERDFHSARSAGIERIYWILPEQDAPEREMYENAFLNQPIFISSLEEIISQTCLKKKK